MMAPTANPATGFKKQKTDQRASQRAPAPACHRAERSEVHRLFDVNLAVSRPDGGPDSVEAASQRVQGEKIIKDVQAVGLAVARIDQPTAGREPFSTFRHAPPELTSQGRGQRCEQWPAKIVEGLPAARRSDGWVDS